MHHVIFKKLKFFNEHMDEQLLEKRNDGGDSFVTFFQRSFADALNVRLNYKLDWDSLVLIATSIKISCSESLYNDSERNEVRKLANHFANIVVIMNNDLFDDGSINTRVLENLASDFNVTLE